jgi:hypothetical protein
LLDSVDVVIDVYVIVWGKVEVLRKHIERRNGDSCSIEARALEAVFHGVI